jgi:molybdenum cofactor cytidylyltransferase
MNPFIPVSCIILSAGSSVRMGAHKAMLKFDENNTFIEKITAEYLSAGIENIIVVVSSDLYKQLNERGIDFPEEIQLVVNENPEQGRFYSLQTGIKILQTDAYCFFQNIDNPFTSAKLLKELITYKASAEVILPTFQNKTGHPVLLSPVVTQAILKEKNSDIRIDQFLKKFDIKRIETSDSSILTNINSMEDYLKVGFTL